MAIVANAGGAAALAADACADHGLQVVRLGAATKRALRGLLPPAAVVTGPVDTCAVVTTEAFRACVQEVAADDGVDAVRRLFAAGLALEAAAGLPGDHRAAGKVQQAISELDLAVRGLRDMVFDHHRPDLPAAGRRG